MIKRSLTPDELNSWIEFINNSDKPINKNYGAHIVIDWDIIDCIDTGIKAHLIEDSILDAAWDRYGDILMNEDKMTAWINHDVSS